MCRNIQVFRVLGLMDILVQIMNFLYISMVTHFQRPGGRVHDPQGLDFHLRFCFVSHLQPRTLPHHLLCPSSLVPFFMKFLASVLKLFISLYPSAIAENKNTGKIFLADKIEVLLSGGKEL